MATDSGPACPLRYNRAPAFPYVRLQAAPNLQYFAKGRTAGARMFRVINRVPAIDVEDDGADSSSKRKQQAPEGSKTAPGKAATGHGEQPDVEAEAGAGPSGGHALAMLPSPQVGCRLQALVMLMLCNLVAFRVAYRRRHTPIPHGKGHPGLDGAGSEGEGLAGAARHALWMVCVVSQSPASPARVGGEPSL